MASLLQRLLNDEAGFVHAAELVLISTITVLGLIVGLSEVSWNVNQELMDVGNAFNHVNQSYSGGGSQGNWGWSSSSNFNNQPTICGIE
jgi:Flp pilus assembly pilin Flp